LSGYRFFEFGPRDDVPLVACAHRFDDAMMLRHASVLLLLSSALSSAPFQCSSEPDPSEALEETPGEALYNLAQRFAAEGDEDAWRRTLQHLVEQYPSSRFAVMARHDLAERPR
jgi:hypothetical protein